MENKYKKGDKVLIKKVETLEIRHYRHLIGQIVVIEGILSIDAPYPYIAKIPGFGTMGFKEEELEPITKTVEVLYGIKNES